MFTYYLELAWRGLRRSPGLTVLMVLAIGFGVAASMTTYSVYRAVSGDPIPWKSSRLFVPQIDMWGPGAQGSDGEPPPMLDYADATALMRDHRARHQSAIYVVAPTVIPSRAGVHPENVLGYAVYSEFFPMLDVPFRFGSGWGAGDDTGRSAVVVIGSALNDKLFGGEDSVGRTVNVDGKDYRVVGVLDDWRPQPVFFDAVDVDFNAEGPGLFLPFARAIAMNLVNAGATNCSELPKMEGFAGRQLSSCVWIAFMAELDDAAAVAAYRRYLDDYAAEQTALGRFHWAPNNRLRNVRAFLDYLQVVPGDTRVALLVAQGLLFVCLVNTVGLLLAKFLRRSGEIGVRRALGAPRRAIYAQFLIEAGVIGTAGGVLGVLLTAAGVGGVVAVLPRRFADLAYVDLPLLGSTLLLAVGSTLLAGLYPTFRAARVQPAWQLKSN